METLCLSPGLLCTCSLRRGSAQRGRRATHLSCQLFHEDALALLCTFHLGPVCFVGSPFVPVNRPRSLGILLYFRFLHATRRSYH